VRNGVSNPSNFYHILAKEAIHLIRTLKKTLTLALIAIAALGLLGLTYITRPSSTPSTNEQTLPEREDKIPAAAIKSTPQEDVYPPILHSDQYENPEPLTSGVNTAGGEDSPFITPSGDTLYFFFTPDVSVPAEKQILDEVTGIYKSDKLLNGTWSKAHRILLQDKGRLAIDGAQFIQDNKMYFASAREGYTGIHWFQADLLSGRWTNWRSADNELKKTEYDTGELHISPDGKTLYFHSPRSGGVGGLDIWYSNWVNGSWGEPRNLGAVNTADNEGWPALNPSGDELWFTRTYLGSPAIYRSQLINGAWGSPKLILSQFAGEPSIDSEGNVYFVHHYYKDSVMLEADIYVIRPIK
jgi:hypothetical protein